MQGRRRTWQSVGTVEPPYLVAAGLVETTLLCAEPTRDKRDDSQRALAGVESRQSLMVVQRDEMTW